MKTYNLSACTLLAVLTSAHGSEESNLRPRKLAESSGKNVPGKDNGITCAEFNAVTLRADKPVLLDVDGSNLFDGGIDGTVGDQVFANKFILETAYAGTDFEIEKFEIQSICTFVADLGDAPQAPSCDFEIEFAYCKKSNPSNKKCYRDSKLFARGTGAPFGILGGTRRFQGAFGSVSGDIRLGEFFRFSDVVVKLCHYKKNVFASD